MKRGRPNIRRVVQEQIITTLNQIRTPITISTLLKKMSQSVNREISWNTIQKYVQELVESGKIQAIQLPHSKIENRTGLVVYTLKR